MRGIDPNCPAAPRERPAEGRSMLQWRLGQPAEPRRVRRRPEIGRSRLVPQLPLQRHQSPQPEVLHAVEAASKLLRHLLKAHPLKMVQ